MLIIKYFIIPIFFLVIFVLFSCTSTSARFYIQNISQPLLMGNKISKTQTIDEKTRTMDFIAGSTLENISQRTGPSRLEGNMVVTPKIITTTIKSDAYNDFFNKLNNDSNKYVGQLYFVVSEMMILGGAVEHSEIEYLGIIYQK
ncbi:MAG: hypothetical protein HW421_2472 [Ignavibacteria bacterium]|nr:hypothetical protein [Ignavibacteria bacterium]